MLTSEILKEYIKSKAKEIVDEEIYTAQMRVEERMAPALRLKGENRMTTNALRAAGWTCSGD